MATSDIFLGRQPILDRDQRIVAYELLFRSGNTASVTVTDDMQATASVIHHAFSELGVQAVLGSQLGFINVSADMLLSDLVELLPREQVVLELLETIIVTDAVIERCRALKQQGRWRWMTSCSPTASARCWRWSTSSRWIYCYIPRTSCVQRSASSSHGR